MHALRRPSDIFLSTRRASCPGLVMPRHRTVQVTAYTPGPVDVGPQIWAGALAGVIPFAIGSWEFGKRIIIQRRCVECSGSGLVRKGRYYRKCPECGGFFPWQGWKRFFTSTAAPGNGGVLRAPRGQTSVFYRVPPKRELPPTQSSAELKAEDNAHQDNLKS